MVGRESDDIIPVKQFYDDICGESSDLIDFLYLAAVNRMANQEIIEIIRFALL